MPARQGDEVAIPSIDSSLYAAHALNESRRFWRSVSPFFRLIGTGTDSGVE